MEKAAATTDWEYWSADSKCELIMKFDSTMIHSRTFGLCFGQYTLELFVWLTAPVSLPLIPVSETLSVNTSFSGSGAYL